MTVPEQDWARPRDCHCITMEQRSHCYENCDPVEPTKRNPHWKVILIVSMLTTASVLATIAMFMLGTHGAKSADLSDPYECFGAGRYDAMSRGFDKTDCPKPGQEFDDIDGHYRYPLGHVAWKLPTYCGMFKLMERSCTSARLVVKMYGHAGAEKRARSCGATDADIAEANACPKIDK